MGLSIVFVHFMVASVASFFAFARSVGFMLLGLTRPLAILCWALVAAGIGTTLDARAWGTTVCGLALFCDLALVLWNTSTSCMVTNMM